MRTETGKAIHLSGYRVPDYLVERVELDFILQQKDTLITARLRVVPNPAGRAGEPLRFDGDGLNVLDVELDGALLDEANALISPDGLTIFVPPRKPFTLITRTRIDPAANTQLSGLYSSGGVYCTQCEAEGFRRITYFPDRPDVLSIYTTRIEADREEAAVLLGNGNRLEQGELENGKHFAIWHDPHPKPCYLFALVGGNLSVLEDDFTTMSGKTVKLSIYVEPGKQDRADYAMDALKRSMKWDEQVFGREYDLDVFNIVAVSDFNMGAMENKGLNIFNDKYVLASPETATDADFSNIEAIIAHEYFHNWTGNRITCRDWFQLCLKEGLTVYRDQEFSADQRSRPVKRIADVRALRAAQFPEDAGPLAHNVRPETYHEINNFYTATVYQKGAEVIRTLKNFIGEEAFRNGMELYFERFDGTAAVVEDFIGCFSDASGKDLAQFMRWYTQTGTPLVTVTSTFNVGKKSLTVNFVQTAAPRPVQTNNLPYVIPVQLGLVSHDGSELPLQTPEMEAAGGATAQERTAATFILDKPDRTIEFLNVNERPALSLLRSLSAPVRLESDAVAEDYLALAAYDSDMFNRWQAIQAYSTRILLASVAAIHQQRSASSNDQFNGAISRLLSQWEHDPEFIAQALSLPGDADIAREIGVNIDTDAIHMAGRALRTEIGSKLMNEFRDVYDDLSQSSPWNPGAAGSGRRAMRGVALGYLMAGGKELAIPHALKQFQSADNMTDKISALSVLCQHVCAEREIALKGFHDTHKDDHLVMDKWFALQAMIPDSTTLGHVQALMKHPLFSMSNPNRFRSLVSTFAMANPTQFNARDGAGYNFVADMVLQLDTKNPQLAARLLVAFRSWRTLEPVRHAAAEAALKQIADRKNLSADVRDIISRTIGG